MFPLVFEIAGFQVRYFGLTFALGIVAAYFLMQRDLKNSKLEMSADELLNMLVYSFFGGLLGARVFYVMFNLEFYTSEKVPWWEFLAFWNGGLSIQGALLFGPIALFLFARHEKLPFPNLADLSAAPLILAQALGRFGNFLNGDAHGIPTQLPWGVIFRHGPAAKQYPGVALHPVMLYEMGLNLAVFAVLYSIRGARFRPGFVVSLYLILYGVIRFFMSFFRADELLFFGFKASQGMGMISIIVGSSLIFGLDLYKEAKTKETQYLPSRKWNV